jgi:lipopolysaccharide export system ATP-binding protein
MMTGDGPESPAKRLSGDLRQGCQQLIHSAADAESPMATDLDSSLLQTHDLVKRYGGRTVVDRVSFRVSKGEIVGLLGRNGAGKTTSFRMTIGMIKRDGGRVIFAGEDVSDLPMYMRARRGMGYLSQEPSVFQRLTVEQNLLAILETMRQLSRHQRRQRAQDLMQQMGLAYLRRQQARTLSGGERRKLEIARALVTEPTLILLDEPFSGVDPIAVEDLQREILRLREEHGIAILLTDHNVHETLRVTDRSYIIDDGKVICEGRPQQLVNDPLVRRTYLGTRFRAEQFEQPLSDTGSQPAEDRPLPEPAENPAAT